MTRRALFKHILSAFAGSVLARMPLAGPKATVADFEASFWQSPNPAGELWGIRYWISLEDDTHFLYCAHPPLAQ